MSDGEPNGRSGRRGRRITTVSYACLSLFDEEPLTASQMIAGMNRQGLRYLWPRAESRLYEEPHVLCQQGLAEVVGDKRRGRGTRYQITDEGRARLGEWLDQPGGTPSIEYEALLKLYCGSVDRERVLVQIEAMKDHIVRGYVRLMKVTARLGAEGIDTPSRARVSALLFQFSASELEARARWVLEVERYVRAWPDELPGEAEVAAIQEWLLDRHNELVRSLSAFRAGEVPEEPSPLPDGAPVV